MVLLLATATLATAQTQENFFSVRAGINFADLQNHNFYSESQTGFNAAVLYNVALMQQTALYLQTGVGMQMKGARNTGIISNVGASHLKSYMVEVPLTVSVDLPTGVQSAIVPMLGAYYSFAFAGTLKNDFETIHQFRKEEYTTADGESFESRLMQQSDVGIRAGLSFRYNRCLFGVAYDAGLMNIFAKEFRDMGYKAFTGTWSINLEYRFN